MAPNKPKLKFTTVALQPNQYLIRCGFVGTAETYFQGYTDRLRDRKLDGYYFNAEVTRIA